MSQYYSAPTSDPSYDEADRVARMKPRERRKYAQEKQHNQQHEKNKDKMLKEQMNAYGGPRGRGKSAGSKPGRGRGAGGRGRGTGRGGGGREESKYEPRAGRGRGRGKGKGRGKAPPAASGLGATMKAGNTSSSNIRVSVRIRPLNRKEERAGDSEVWGADAAGKNVEELTSANGDGGEFFSFDSAFGPQVETSQVYDSECQSIVEAAFEGYNGTMVKSYKPNRMNESSI